MYVISISVAIFIATILVAAGQPIEHATANNGSSTRKLHVIGTVDGKSYFSEDTLCTWKEASSICLVTGMRLATIVSRAQWNFLATSHDPTIFDSDHWTSLRDSHQSSQFSWDLAQAEPSTTIGLVWDPSNNHVGSDYITCVSFNSKPREEASLRAERCATRMKVLCETD